MRRRLPVPRGDRALRLGGALLAAALLWLPVRHAGADAGSPPAEVVQPAAAETGAVDSSKVAADSLEAGAVDADSLDAATRAVEFRLPFLSRGLRLDGSMGILREVDRRWRLKTFFADATPSKAEPERQSSK